MFCYNIYYAYTDTHFFVLFIQIPPGKADSLYIHCMCNESRGICPNKICEDSEVHFILHIVL